MMDAEQQLFGMMAVLEEQQKAVKVAIDGLTAERTATAKDRESMSQVLTAVKDAAGGVRKAAGDAVEASVRQSLASASGEVARVVSEAAKPAIERLERVAKAVRGTEDQLNGAVAAFGWRWAMVAGGAAAGAILTVLLVAWISVGWQRHQVETLSEEVAQLKATAADLAKRGGRAEITVCGEKRRLCARVDNAKEAYGENRDYFVLKGY